MFTICRHPDYAIQAQRLGESAAWSVYMWIETTGGADFKEILLNVGEAISHTAL